MRLLAAVTVLCAIGTDAHAQRPPVRSWQLLVDGAPGAFLASASSTQTAAGVEETLAATPGGMQPALWSWIAPAVDGQDPRRSATLVGVSVDAKASSATMLAGASIRKVVFPAMDVTDRTPLQIGITLSAAATAPATATGNPERPGPSYLASSFRFAIDGMATTRTAAVGPITITMQPEALAAATAPPGIGLGAPLVGARTGPRVSVAPLTVKIAQGDAIAFQQWLAVAPGTKRAGSVQYLDASLKQGFPVALKGLAITRVTMDSAASRATIELNVDGASVSPP